MLSGARCAGRKRRYSRIYAASDDGSAREQSRGLGPCRLKMADDIAGSDQPLRHHGGRNVERVQHAGGPAARVDVVDAADVSRRGMIDGEFTGQLRDHPSVRRHQGARAGPDIRTFIAQPQHLGEAVIAVDAIAGSRLEQCNVNVRTDAARLRLCPAIEPDQAGMQRFERRVHGDAGAAVQAADAHGPHIGSGFWRDAAADRGHHRIEPDLRPLFGPQRTRCIGLVRFAGLRQDASGGVGPQRLGALRADVDTDDKRCVRHGRVA